MQDKKNDVESEGREHRSRKTVKPFSEKQNELPVEHVGFVSFLVYAWLDGFMWKAFRGQLDDHQQWTCPEVDSVQVNADRLERLWKEEVEKSGVSGASLSRVFVRFVRKRCLIASLFLIISTGLLLFSVAYIMMSILQLTVADDVHLWHGLVLVAALFLSSILSQFLFIGSVTVAHIAGGRLRAAVLYLLFKKLMKTTSIKDETIGKIVNLYSNDSLRIFDGVSMGHMILCGPLLVVGATAYAIYLLRAWALIGFAVLLLLLPLQGAAGKLFMKFRGQAIVLTDARVRMMTEYLVNVRFIKMYSWEKALIAVIAGARTAEQKMLEKVNISMSVVFMTAGILVSIATMCTLIAYTMCGNHLSGVHGFMYLLIYSCIQDKLEMCMLAVKLLSEFFVGAERFQEIFRLPGDCGDDSAEFQCSLPVTNASSPDDGGYSVQMNDFSFRWPFTSEAEAVNDDDKDDDRQKQKKEKKEEPKLNENLIEEKSKELEILLVTKDEDKQERFGKFNLKITKGQFVGIMGQVSSGKTALIKALLGQMHVTSGNFNVYGRLAYVPQQPWIFHATVRENILLGSEYNTEKYKAVLQSCCLVDDLAILSDGDSTEIGERGVTLSGGQKQRISLARAVYSDRDVYLLDDPLSSLDPDVAESIFQNVVRRVLLGKTVLLVTHQLKFLSKCDVIVHLSERQLLEFGSHEELLYSNGSYAQTAATAAASPLQNKDLLPDNNHSADLSCGLLHNNPDSTVDSAGSKFQTSDNTKDSGVKNAKGDELMTEEEKVKGSVSTTTYLAYIKAGGGLPAILVVLLVSILAELCRAFSYWWLAHWLEDGSGQTKIVVGNETLISDNIADNPLLWMYNLVYGMSLVAILVFFALRSIVIIKVLMRASSGLHDQLVKKAFRTPIRFFDTTPLGRLINRFSRDMDEMDSKLPMFVENTLKSLLNIVIYMALISAIMPWFLVSVPVVGAIFVVLFFVFRSGVYELQRSQLVSMSPLLSHVDATLRGLSSIRAYNKMADFAARFRVLLDRNTVSLLLSNFAARWVGIRLSVITTALVSCTALLIFLLRFDIPTSYCGAAIIYAFQLLTLFQFFVKFAVDAGATFASTERIHSYIKTMEEESPLITKTFALPKKWPAEGAIEFVDVKLRYRDGLPLVLDGVSFRIASKEKIGIVGRTGAGKSSLVGALFRMAEVTGGRIEIDGINIGLIGLEELRTKLSIIPQDPVLFSGTIRSNLDPFNHHIDQELWNALERCHLKDTVLQMDGLLSSKVLENGENLSHGERQLLTLARVLLRHTRIIIFDEATASLDQETDDKLQSTMRQTFDACTVLIIAHRLKTVIGCDRVMVIDEGKILEFDPPDVLLADRESRLSRLVAIGSSTSLLRETDIIDDDDDLSKSFACV